MTRKDYIVIAEALRVQMVRANNAFSSEDVNEARSAGAFANGVMQAANEIADSLKRDNVRFSKPHFMAVVNGERALLSRPKRGER